MFSYYNTSRTHHTHTTPATSLKQHKPLTTRYIPLSNQGGARAFDSTLLSSYFTAMGASDSKGKQSELDSQDDYGNLHDDTADTGATSRRNYSRREPRSACIVSDDGGGLEFKPPTNHYHHYNRVYRDTEPRVILDNKSSYRVSYWVLEEDKDVTVSKNKANPEQLVGSMRRYLNASNNVRGRGRREREQQTVGGARGEGDEEEDEEDEEKGVYFLTRDHRMEPRGRTQATKVAFPAGCEKMRVCGFFEGADGQWHQFQDKEISIGLFRKVFTVTGADADIAPYNTYTHNNTRAAAHRYDR